MISFFKALTKFGLFKITIDIFLICQRLFNINDWFLFICCLFSGITTILMIYDRSIIFKNEK